ncbi:hypothetical protein [Streptococcus loxodontisalivarius]|uniref:Acetyltransferase n=1 Tax=Streptococcus loxodontisalivarius TaxID=1349415 RepID=A0ABS2PP73_9STRE|nr:hypothetical protein [Streptococcus loxodontisalivarius]MBM7641833.1 hypothetical protein [Streptococcus loxodontisalivarius]
MIREVQSADFCQLVPLYEQLGYPVDELELINRLEQLLLHEDYHLLVIESSGEIKGFLGYAKMYFLSILVFISEY